MFFKIFTTLIAIIAMTWAFYFQFVQIDKKKTIRQVEYAGDDIQIKIIELSKKQEEINQALSKVLEAPLKTQDYQALEIKLNNFEDRLQKINGF